MRLIDVEDLTRDLDDYDEISVYDIRHFLEVEAIPISWLVSYAQNAGKALIPFKDMLNDWRRINGKH